MPDVIKEILKFMPEDDITDAGFEGANIVLYTTNKDFFLNCGKQVRKAVNHVKKRIEVRPDPKIALDKHDAQGKLMDMIPEEAGVAQIIFDEQRSTVIIEAEKPGLVIGKGGETIRMIQDQTGASIMVDDGIVTIAEGVARAGEAEICEDLGPDRQVAWHALGSVLRTIRDRLPVELAAFEAAADGPDVPRAPVRRPARSAPAFGSVGR